MASSRLMTLGDWAQTNKEIKKDMVKSSGFIS
jgi:hypothetical protein